MVTRMDGNGDGNGKGYRDRSVRQNRDGWEWRWKQAGVGQSGCPGMDPGIGGWGGGGMVRLSWDGSRDIQGQGQLGCPRMDPGTDPGVGQLGCSRWTQGWEWLGSPGVDTGMETARPSRVDGARAVLSQGVLGDVPRLRDSPDTLWALHRAVTRPQAWRGTGAAP